jgi:hypothetical protein
MKTLSIGRDAGNDIVINDKFVSRNHAQINILDNGQVLLRDMGSSNGTFVNGNKITEYYLMPGDIVKCANAFLNWQNYMDPHVQKQVLAHPDQPEIKNALKIELQKKSYLIVNYLAIAFLFFLPFCDIKCGSETIKTVSGIDLMIGTDIKQSNVNPFNLSYEERDDNHNNNDKIEPNIFIIVAFLSSIIGIIFLLFNKNIQFKVSFVTGIVGLISLFAFMIQIGNNLSGQVSVEYKFPFWITMMFFLIAITLSYMKGFQNKRYP